MNPPPETYSQAFARLRAQYREQLQDPDQLAAFDSMPHWLPLDLLRQLPPKETPADEEKKSGKAQPDNSHTHFHAKNEQSQQDQHQHTMNGATNAQQEEEKPGFWKRVKNWISTNWDKLLLGVLLLAGIIWMIWKIFFAKKERRTQSQEHENTYRRRRRSGDFADPDFA
jgi:G3E family GTPase